MKNEWFMNMLKKADEHLPGLLVIGGIIVGLTTVGYSVYAGYKIKEVNDDDSLDTKEKAKKIALIAAPAAIGAAISTTCEVCAHKEHTKRYAALGAVVAASKATNLVDRKEVKKVKELVTGKKEVKTVLPEGADPSKMVTIMDLETGFEFSTTLFDFMNAVTAFNSEDVKGDAHPTIADFYQKLLGDRYNFCSAHDQVKFGMHYDDGMIAFAPEIGSWVRDDLKLEYSISYDYINK